MLEASGAGETARLAADALLPARGRVIDTCSEASLPPRARVPSAACAGAGAGTGKGARRTGMKRAGGTGVAAARAQSRSSSGLSSGKLSMLRTLADLRSALAETALAMETQLAVESVEYTEPAALASAPDRPSGMQRTVVPGSRHRRALDDPRRAEAARARAPRLLVAESLQPSPVVRPSPPRMRAEAAAHALARRVARVLVEPLFVGGAEALVEVEVELEKMEDGRERQGEQIVWPRRKRASSTGRVGRRKACDACARVSSPHICIENHEHARQQPVHVEPRIAPATIALHTGSATQPVVLVILRERRGGSPLADAPAHRERLQIDTRLLVAE
jgi:hypothetical protein